jgi:twitching motility two-component system response regulator PilG
VVLIVDDHQDTAKLLARLLQLNGHEARAICNPMQALELLPQLRPDVIVLDVMMPEMDGPTLLRAIRNSVTFSKTPVVMYSADLSQDRYSETQRLGAQDYIVKGSTDVDELCNRICKYDQPSLQ